MEMRPLGIPTIYCRCVQALISLVIDVQQEHKADGRSFAFRKNRNAQQAIDYIHKMASKNGYRYVLSVDIRKFFDSINHRWIYNNLINFNKIIWKILKAGIQEKNRIEYTKSGTPQGGITSPILANIALNGIEKLCLNLSGRIKNRTIPVRYADDLIILGKNLPSLENLLIKIKEFLAERGLVINEKKTSFGNIEEGFNWLGFTFREYPDNRISDKFGKKGKFIITPSKKSIAKLKETIKTVFKKYRSKSNYLLILKLNPILRGWANYYRCSSITKIFNSIGYFL
jgi:RNA-directed DNA polymerase